MHNSDTRKHQPSATHVVGVESFDTWFDREMASIKLDLARLETIPAAQPNTTPMPQRRGKRSADRSSADAALAPAKAAPPLQDTPPLPPSTEIWPTGTDLADPKNFGVHPPTRDLERGEATEDDYRQRLTRHIGFATKVLHTSRVPAVVWRDWRVFEKTAQERLRELAKGPVVIAGTDA